jgi:hypothetical protein
LKAQKDEHQPTLKDRPHAIDDRAPKGQADQHEAHHRDRFERLYWLIAGSVFSIVTFGLITWSLMSNDESCDKWTLLKYALPLFPGLAAGAFLGSINVKGKVGDVAVAAGGGFAVWLIALLAIPAPARCAKPIMGNVIFFQEANATGELSARMPSSLDRGDEPHEYDPDQPKQFVLFLGASVRNIYQGPKRSAHVRFELSGLRNNGTPAWTDVLYLQSLDEWRSGELAKKFGTQTIESKLGLGDTSTDNVMVILVGSECRETPELREWTGRLRIRVFDLGFDGNDPDDERNARYISLPAKVDLAMKKSGSSATNKDVPDCIDRRTS